MSLTSHRPSARGLIAAAALLATFSATAAPLPLLRITDLDAATGLTDTRAVAVSNTGAVLGYQIHGDAFVLQPDGTLQRVKAPQGAASMAPEAINDEGLVVGTLRFPNASYPFTWTAEQGVQRIELRELQRNGQARGVNNQGQIVGSAQVKVKNNWPSHALIGSTKLGLDDPRHTREGQSEAWAINNHGRVGGVATDAGRCCYSAVLMDAKGRRQWLGTLAAPGENDYSAVRALNDADQAVGGSAIHPALQRAFFWSAGTGMQLLNVGPGDDEWSEAWSINASAQVVGNYGNTNGQRRVSSSFYWDAEHGAVSLQSLLDPADPLTAHTTVQNMGGSINNRGQIVTEVQIDGRYTGALLTPVP